MTRKYGSFLLIGCLALFLAPAPAGAQDQNIAWDMISSTSMNLVSFGTDAPVFSSPGDGFQKYTVGVSPSIPYTLVDATNASYPADSVGIIDEATDFDEFFGVVDIINNDNTGPLSATWVFDISAGTANLQLFLDLAAMGDFEADDSYEWSYQVDGGAATTFLTAVADEDGTLTYTMADGTTRDLDDPLTVNGVTLYNHFQTFSTPIPTGSQLTLTLTALTDGGSEGYVARNILVTASTQPPSGGGGEPIPTITGTGIAVMVLLLAAGALVLFRRRH